jgi:oligopeptide transport system permease protein
MLRFIFIRILGGIATLLVIVTLSFFLMRFAPGSPFDEDRKLPPQVEANKWMWYGMGEELVAPKGGKISSLGQDPEGRPLIQGADYSEDLVLVTLTPADGSSAIDVMMPRSGKLVSLGVQAGDTVEEGARLAVVPKAMMSQYLDTLWNYARGNFGRTISSDGEREVWENIVLALPVSLELGFWSLLLAMILGVSAGLFAGLKQNTWGDYAVMSVSMLGISVPTIVSGPVFIAIFLLGMPELGLRLGEWETAQDRFLPVLTLSLVYVASFARLTRGGMLEIIHSDYIRTARAKGLPEILVVTRHALKGAILPTVSYLGPAAARIITGSVVVEMVFNLPGLATYFIQPALARDYPMVLGVVVLYSILLIVMNLIVDIAYTFLDPRVKYD